MQGATDGKDGQLVRTYTAQQRQQQKQKQKQQAAGAKQQQQGKRPPKQRLKQLKQAYEEGLIDGDAYNVAQRALAAEIAGVSFTTKCVVRHTDGTAIETTSSSAAAAAATPARGGGAAGRAVPAHDMEATIARLSTGREDVRVHDEAVVEYCIDRLLETNDGVSPATVCPMISRAAV